jgi:hypothetical protein
LLTARCCAFRLSTSGGLPAIWANSALFWLVSASIRACSVALRCA